MATHPALPRKDSAPPGRRLLAALVDLAILWVAGELVVVFFLEEFLAMGRRGRLIGALFFLAYIGGQNSTLTQGQTFGKRLLKLRTVSLSGGYVSLERSILRAGLLLLPFLTRGLFFFPQSLLAALALNGLWMGLSWGLGSALMFSYLRCGRTGTALHDHVFGTRVVFEGVDHAPSSGNSAVSAAQQRRHPWWLIGTCIAIGSLCGSALTYVWGGGEHWEEVVRAQRAIREIADVSRAEVFRGVYSWRGLHGEVSQTRFVQASAFYRAPVTDAHPCALAVAERVLEFIRDDTDALRITVGWEFDVLIAQRQWSKSFVRSPSDWRSSLQVARNALQATTTMGSAR